MLVWSEGPEKNHEYEKISQHSPQSSIGHVAKIQPSRVRWFKPLRTVLPDSV